MAMPQPTRVLPFTVIGGFLGAGKTTFVNRLLAQGGARFAVLVNDFGAINVDAGLIAEHDGATMTLTNGCVCCNSGADFFRTLNRVLDRAELFDHVVVEASGVGDPWRIAEIALVEPGFSLNGVIVLVDAAAFLDQLSDTRIADTVQGQLARASLVLVNKADLVDGAALDTVMAAIAAIRPGIATMTTIEADAPGALIAGGAPTGRLVADAPYADHEARFGRYLYEREAAFDPARLALALKRLGPHLLRLKGACALTAESGTRLLQMSGDRWSLGDEVVSVQPRAIALVGIGRADMAPAAVLDALLDAALAAPPDSRDGASRRLSPPPRSSSANGGADRRPTTTDKGISTCA